MDGVGLAEDGRKAEVANLDLALVAVHEDVVTLEVPVALWLSSSRRELSMEGSGAGECERKL